MKRRRFLQTLLQGASLTLLTGARGITPAAPFVMTVNGPVNPKELGVTLPHEHVLVDFISATEITPDRYDPDEAYRVIIPYLKQLLPLEGRTLVECTPAYLGRDPLLLQRLSRATGLHILTNTGYYGARQDQNLPAHAFSESADQLAARWIQEFEHGIDNTGVKPGFIKIGVDDAKLSEVDKKLVQAAARTHLRTGLTIAAHTGPAVAAFDELTVLSGEGVHPAAWIWVHAQNEDNIDNHLRAAEQGAWISFDGVSIDKINDYVGRLSHMKEGNLLHRVLISHDAGWYHVGEPDGGDFRPYTPLFTHLLPALQKAGFTESDIRRLVVTNPADAFQVRVRSL